MQKATAPQLATLKILVKQKGPMQLNTLQKKYKGKILKTTLDSLVSKELVRIRKGYDGRTDRYEIRAAGRIIACNK